MAGRRRRPRRTLPRSWASRPPPTPHRRRISRCLWDKGFFNGVASDGTNVFTVGASHPGDGLTSDGSGGAEVKTLLARFNADGIAGSSPAPATDYAANNFFSYRGVEIFQDVLVTTQGGNTVVYAVGYGQPASYGAYVIASYDVNGNLLHSATDPLAVPGFSIARDVVEFNGQIWAVGYSEHPAIRSDRAMAWAANYELNSVATYKDTLEIDRGQLLRRRGNRQQPLCGRLRQKQYQRLSRRQVQY